ncbi:class I SAM-dependent methyltransferase [Candidatus Saccharibacteria bacterium]|nr:class I SAM-dependent methyltransferase [Candidatus Saccharibacteria bacterium]
MLIIGIISGFVIALFLLTALIGAPYVPSHRQDVKALFESIALNNKDVVVDIGSGDGVVLKVAAQAGARAIGYEINPILVAIARLRCYSYRHLVKVKCLNFWQAQFPNDVTVFYTFGESRDIRRLYNLARTHVQRTGKKVTFVSYSFRVPHADAPEQKKGAMYIYTLQPLQVN